MEKKSSSINILSIQTQSGKQNGSELFVDNGGCGIIQNKEDWPGCYNFHLNYLV